jgi:hypothetical protein
LLTAQTLLFCSSLSTSFRRESRFALCKPSNKICWKPKPG